MEKKFFSEMRKKQLIDFPNLSSLEQWGNYCLIPLDIQRFEYPDLVEWFFQKALPTYRTKSDSFYRTTGQTQFDAVDVIPDNSYQEDNYAINLRQDFMTDFKYVYDRIMECFPFTSLSRIRMWSSTKDIPYHNDYNKFIDFPNAFRIMLYDENHSQTLSLIPSLPDRDIDINKKFFIPRLSSTNSYVWNNLRIKHGSKFFQGKRKIVMILDRYDLDIDRYNTLIKNSVDKYQAECLMSNESIEKFVDI